MNRFINVRQRSDNVKQITLLYGTGNPAKFKMMSESLKGLPIDLISVCDMEKAPPEVDESGSSPLENACIKAQTYYRFYGVPVLSQDCGLYFDNVPDEVQPGIHVRNVGGKRLSDAEMTAYYGSLAEKYGGKLTARYKTALCLALSETRVFESMDQSLWGGAFHIVEKPHPKRVEGFPIDTLSVDIATGKYFYDLPDCRDVNAHPGFRKFFENLIAKGELL